MANILFLIDTQLNEYEVSNNWVVYRDNVEEVVDSLTTRHNNCSPCETKWDDTFKLSLTKMIIDFYDNNIFSVPINVIKEHLEIKVLNDDKLCIPNKRVSYMFIFNDEQKDADYRVIESQIAGYAIKLILEDLNYERLEWRGNTYRGEDIGYSMTERSEYKIQHATIFLKDGSSMTMYCYKVLNYISHDS